MWAYFFGIFTQKIGNILRKPNQKWLNGVLFRMVRERKIFQYMASIAKQLYFHPNLKNAQSVPAARTSQVYLKLELCMWTLFSFSWTVGTLTLKINNKIWTSNSLLLLYAYRYRLNSTVVYPEDLEKYIFWALFPWSRYFQFSELDMASTWFFCMIGSIFRCKAISTYYTSIKLYGRPHFTYALKHLHVHGRQAFIRR